MVLYDKIKKMIAGFDGDDGSKEVARQWMELLETEADMKSLMLNNGFKKIIKNLKGDFRDRMEMKVKEDPELMATKKMLIRVLGSKGAEEEIEKLVDNYLDETIEV